MQAYEHCFKLVPLYLGLFLSFPYLYAEQNALVDRVLVSINSKSYSQRHMETYLTARYILDRTSAPDGKIIIDKTTWKRALRDFIDDMVIQQEAERLGSYKAPRDLFTQSVAAVTIGLDNDPKLNDLKSRLDLDIKTMVRIVSATLRIRTYRENRNRQEQYNQGRTNRADAAEWLRELKSRAFIRRYQGHEKYKVIFPVMAKKTES